MSFYRSAGSTDEWLHHNFEDQSSATQFDARSQQQVNVMVSSTQVDVQPHNQFYYGALVDDGRQHRFDQGTSNTLASTSWRQNEIDKSTEAEYYSSNTQFRDTQQRPFDDLSPGSELSDRSQLRQLGNQNSDAQLNSGSSAPAHNSAEVAPVRLPTFSYREPLPPYIPDESSPVEFHGRVVSPRSSPAYRQPFVPNESSPVDYHWGVAPPGSIPAHRQPVLLVTYIPSPQPPQSYMGWSMVSMLCCCLPLGIAAVVCSSLVTSDYAAGRYREAQRRSDSARRLNIAATVLGVIVLVVAGILNGLRLTGKFG